MAASKTFAAHGVPPRNTSAFGLSLVAETSDGWVGFAAPSDTIFTRFSNALQRDDWLIRFPSAEDRRMLAEELVEEIRVEFRKRKAQDIVEKLRLMDVPCEIIRTSMEAASDSYLIESGLVSEGEQEGLVTVLPLTVDGHRIRFDLGTPGYPQ